MKAAVEHPVTGHNTVGKWQLGEAFQCHSLGNATNCSLLPRKSLLLVPLAMLAFLSLCMVCNDSHKKKSASNNRGNCLHWAICEQDGTILRPCFDHGQLMEAANRGMQIGRKYAWRPPSWKKHAKGRLQSSFTRKNVSKDSWYHC